MGAYGPHLLEFSPPLRQHSGGTRHLSAERPTGLLREG